MNISFKIPDAKVTAQGILDNPFDLSSSAFGVHLIVCNYMDYIERIFPLLGRTYFH
jgi:hypothetical protein